ncbi:SRRT [Cordylochernes scorpioides]|uniref:Serrate RNA effector molecule homolog n=1 Tax=Cordylochernes scorpioides TaxID=51811 RepID=A0ABY6KF64_9ARAC|nr:SRRT [Cordylochernes scorpioides]
MYRQQVLTAVSRRDESRNYGYDMGFPNMGPPGMWGGPPADMMPGPGFMMRDEPSGMTQPPMMTFKQFLNSQDDTIDDQEAVKKYGEYKLEFKKQQISEFFLSHKEEEWFKSKYHPEEYGKRKAEQKSSQKKRLEVFMELMNKGWLDNFSLDGEKSDKILRFLDAGSRAGSDDEGPKPEAPEKGDKKEEGEKKEENGEEDEEEPKEPKPRPLHKTQSIFLRNLAPNITKKEVELICKKYPGYLRVAIADPQPDRRFFRRGWVTFKPNVNIKDICWDLNNIRLVQLRDYELGAIVNRDLTRRIRMVNGITSHKAVARSDVKTAARLVHHLDSQKGVWGEEGPNPLLQNITDYLIEEASAEEEELLGVSTNAEDHEEESVLERDEPLLQVLDRLVLYLRVVHSVDYYNCSDYPSEDEMPNRCGLLHVRGSAPSSKVTQQEINSYLEPFNQKIQAFLQPQTRLSEEEALRMGKKDSEVEVEKFVQSNTQELGKDKWLCPLSGKKFKGPEFVRKHIFNKHSDKVEEVKEEVEYFNNYLMDPRRPQLPEHPANKGRPDMMGPPFGGPPFMRPMPPAMGFPGFGRPDMFGRPFKRTYGGRYSDPRKIIPYRDLDAPEDADI